jgi:hypothetical protein
MPGWFLTVSGWILVVSGCLGLLRGVELSLPRSKATRDSTGMPGPLVLAESGGLALLGVATLLGGRWTFLILPVGMLLAVGEVHRIRRRRHRRQRRSSPPARNEELSGT